MNESQAKYRSYQSPVRKAQAGRTRRSILAAARRLFASQGYTATSLAQIADEVGISVQTIYDRIGGKAAVLLALNEVVDEAGAVGEIQRRIGESRDPEEILRLTARLRRRLMERAGDIVRVLIVTAPVDPEVARVYADGKSRSRTGIRRIVERLHSLGALREDLDPETAADAMYAVLLPEAWYRLTDECGWSADRFENWCADLLQRMLLRGEKG